ncbi:hypothetical protein ACU19_05960 [Actinobaculum suis]|uniref:hypothetical protein n=1 Tax=Actinobaculum suis TaxID=1657 RepID=UPI00066FE2BC|nr:hypothetical protein [Actinobaculum suis]KMY23110.1 hypothetical protein ACU19_05960 [Actinobaculum suis]
MGLMPATTRAAMATAMATMFVRAVPSVLVTGMFMPAVRAVPGGFVAGVFVRAVFMPAGFVARGRGAMFRMCASVVCVA